MLHIGPKEGPSILSEENGRTELSQSFICLRSPHSYNGMVGHKLNYLLTLDEEEVSFQRYIGNRVKEDISKVGSRSRHGNRA